WLYDLIQPHVAKVMVCDPRKITTKGNKADRPDAKRLAELLRTNALTAVYHGERSTRGLKELARSYSAIVGDSTRIKNRLKAVFRARGIDSSGGGIYTTEERECWTSKLEGGQCGCEFRGCGGSSMCSRRCVQKPRRTWW